MDLPETNGHEQSGSRPVVVVAEVSAGITVIIPFPSNLQALRFPNTVEINATRQNGLRNISVALAFQIRAIDRKRLRTKIGYLETATV